jgi:uncharacterized protein YigA (DUF484 family)
MTTSSDHERLLTLARKAYAAADTDAERLEEDMTAFVHLLAGHLGHEVPMLTRIPLAEARILRRGQARLAAAARRLLATAATDCVGSPALCAIRAEELLALLTLQARDERLALHAATAVPAMVSRGPEP